MLFIYDLEGTTGIYSTQTHINDIAVIRPGLVSVLEAHQRLGIPAAIATRAPRHFVNDIKANLFQKGIALPTKTCTKEDVAFFDEKLMPYKYYGEIYEHFHVKNPSKDVVVLGDFLRFSHERMTMQEYRNFDFASHPHVLSSNYALNDHPYPLSKETPIYAIVPQPWTTKDADGKCQTIDLEYVFNHLCSLYFSNACDFSKGFDNAQKKNNSVTEQYITHDGLAQQFLGTHHQQRYLVFKGKDKDWKPLERVY